jgi:acyl-CoA thioesterase
MTAITLTIAPQPPVHPFDLSVALTPAGPDHYHGATHPAYANMVGPFGGTTAAVMLQAALVHPQRLGEPIVQTVNYAAPIQDGAFEVQARPVRTNRSTQHWQLALTQDGQVMATGSAVFALRRPTFAACEATAPVDMPPPEALPRFEAAGRPPWVRAYDMRFRTGSQPMHFDGGELTHSLTEGWVRDEPPRPLDHASLTALCDSFFPRIMIRRRRPVPIGTVSLSTCFHAEAAALAALGTQHVLGVARALNFHGGYFDQRAEVWSRDGALLASSQQMVYFKE